MPAPGGNPAQQNSNRGQTYWLRESQSPEAEAQWDPEPEEHGADSPLNALDPNTEGGAALWAALGEGTRPDRGTEGPQRPGSMPSPLGDVSHPAAHLSVGTQYPGGGPGAFTGNGTDAGRGPQPMSTLWTVFPNTGAGAGSELVRPGAPRWCSLCTLV